MRRVIFLLTIWLLATSSAWAGGGRVALVVGVGAYRNVPALRNPPRDARAIAAKLKSLGFDTELVLDPDRGRFESAIRALGERARSADVALFYYAGHALEAGGQNFLLPTGTDLHTARDLPFEAVGLDLIPAQLEGRARTVLLFLDSCRDNPFALRLASDGRSIAARGLAMPSTGATGTLVVFATAPGRIAQDGGGENSPFTTALLRHIDDPGLEIRQIMSRVRSEVRTETGGAQVPWESSSLEGDFYFRPGTAPPPPVAAVAPAPAAAVPAQVMPAPVAAAPVTPARIMPAPVPPAPVAQAPVAQAPVTPARVTPAPVQPALVPPAPVTPAPVTQNAIQVPPPVKMAMAPPLPSIASRTPSKGEGCDVRPWTGSSTGTGAMTQMRVIENGTACQGRFSGDPKVLSLTTNPAYGSVTFDGNSFFYTPLPGYTGADQFSIRTMPLGWLTVSVTVGPRTGGTP